MRWRGERREELGCTLNFLSNPEYFVHYPESDQAAFLPTLSDSATLAAKSAPARLPFLPPRELLQRMHLSAEAASHSGAI